MKPLDFSAYEFSPVIPFSSEYEVFDFSRGYDAERVRHSVFGVGKYNERRPGMYNTELFTASPEGVRDIHMGVDLAAPAGTPVYAFFEGVIYMTAINPAAGDYGGTVITEHEIGDERLWVLHGHLSHASVGHRAPGTRFAKGELLGWLGESHENGGWNPHLHFQLARIRPDVCDMPGAVNAKYLDEALALYPDPRLVLGPIY